MDKSKEAEDPPPYPGPPGPGFNFEQQAPPVFYQYAAQPQVVHPVTVMVQPHPTDCSGQMICPHCQNNVVTVVEHKPGALTWIICGVIGIFFLWPCCWIPFCIDACKDVEHTCPKCYNVLHIHKRI
ncbi:LITAF domain-containing protein-like [Eucyclogobius newberryi]|uniref:LITAF domain-containing protein-like n=1 Tax=Eucyclogobius newberryi TaxID=166745 RepID=UPI003B5CF48C